MFRALSALARTVGLFLLIVYLLVVGHECGHYFAARSFGVGVVEYSVGSGPLLWSGYVGETKVSFSLYPTGGFNRPAYSGIVRKMSKAELKQLEIEHPAAYKMITDQNRWVEKTSPLQQLVIFSAGLCFQALVAIFMAYLILRSPPCPPLVRGQSIGQALLARFTCLRFFLWLLLMFNVLLLLDNAGPIPGMDGFISLAAGAEWIYGPMNDVQFQMLVEQAFAYYLVFKLVATIVLFIAMLRSLSSPVLAAPPDNGPGNEDQPPSS